MVAGGRSALSGRRVLEIADESGAYCGKLLGDMGADVIKVECPGGDPSRRIPPFLGDLPGDDRSLHFLYMNTSKRGITLDLQQSEGRARLRALALSADIVLETLPVGELDALGIGHASLSAEKPEIVVTSITGFGQTGPHAGWKASDLVAGAVGGPMHVTGEGDDPPVSLAGEQHLLMASTCAAASSMIALLAARRSGRGQHVDISIQETTLSVSHISGVGKWLDDGIIPRRVGTGLTASVPSGAYPCRDGRVYLMVNRPAHWKALAQWIHEETGNKEVLDPLFEGPSSRRIEYRELLDLFICDLTTPRSVEEIFHEGQRRHIAFTPLQTTEDAARDPHLASRNYFVDLEHPVVGRLRYPGAPFRPEATPWALSRPAPRVGEHNAEILGEESRPARPAVRAPRRTRSRDFMEPPALAGLKVVEFTQGMAGPWIGRMLAYCGAEVIRIESRRVPGVVRLYVPPGAADRRIEPEMSPWFTDWDAGKLFVALDLKQPTGVELALRLVGRCDLVVENHRFGAMEKLGLGWEALRAANPDLVAISSNGFGEDGLHPGYVSWGPNIEAMSGMAWLGGFPAREGAMTQYAYPDSLSALHGLFAVLCALYHRERTGEGQRISLAQLETTMAMIGPEMMDQIAHDRSPEKLGNRSHHRAPQGCYPCEGEDRYCVVSVSDHAEWRGLCALIGRDGWAEDPRFRATEGRRREAEAIDQAIGQWTREYSPQTAAELLQAAGVPAGAVQNTEDQYMRDPHLVERGYFETILHLKKGEVIAPGIPLGLTGTPGRTTRAGAAMGEDNESVFRDLLELSESEYAHYVEPGGIEEPPGEEAVFNPN